MKDMILQSHQLFSCLTLMNLIDQFLVCTAGTGRKADAQ